MALFWDDTVLWIQENTGICGHCETVDRLFCQGESLSPVELQMDGFYLDGKIETIKPSKYWQILAKASNSWLAH